MIQLWIFYLTFLCIRQSGAKSNFKSWIISFFFHSNIFLVSYFIISNVCFCKFKNIIDTFTYKVNPFTNFQLPHFSYRRKINSSKINGKIFYSLFPTCILFNHRDYNEYIKCDGLFIFFIHNNDDTEKKQINKSDNWKTLLLVLSPFLMRKLILQLTKNH